MIELNLAVEGKTALPYKVSKFPDGQQAITLFPESTESLMKGVCIKSKLNGFKDLEIIVSANQALKEIEVQEDVKIPVHLYVPYFLGARSDRKFTKGTSNYLKTVICPIVNSQNFSSVTVLDPHSDVLETALNNYKKIDNVDLVKFALTNIVPPSLGLSKTILVSPDAGAQKKIFDVAQAVGYTNEILVAAKHRNVVTGEILSTEVPLNISHDKHDFVIIDDICDGGRTFIEIAKVIQETYPDALIYLTITHGIFSAGFDLLDQYFAGIYCTNSIKDVEHSKLKQLNVY